MTTTPEYPADETEASEPVAVPDEGNLIERLREQRAALAGDRTEVFPIPGYAELGMRFRVLADDRYKAIKQRMGEGKSRGRGRAKTDPDTTALMTDVLINSAVEAVAWIGGEVVPLHERPEVVGLVGDEPIRFDAKLVKIVEPNAILPDPPKARDCLRAIITTSMAIDSLGTDVWEWMQGEDVKIDEEILGE